MGTTLTEPTLDRALDPVEVQLPIEGMTCASCVRRIERSCDARPGSQAGDRQPRDRDRDIRYLPDVAGRSELVGAIESAGYDVRPAARGRPGRPRLATRWPTGDAEAAPARPATCWLRAVASIAVALGIMALMFWPQTAISMDDLNRLALLPATFIQLWAGGRFYRAAWRAARHGATNMDTLVAIGTTAAWGYSVVVDARAARRPRGGPRARDVLRQRRRSIIGLVLLGRWLEARAKGQATGAIRRLRRPPGHVAAARPPAATRDVAARGRPARRPAARPAGREGPGRRRRRRGRLRGRRVDADRRADPGRRRAPATRSSARRWNTTGTFVMRATRVGRDTALARIVELVQRAQGSQGADPAPGRPDQRGLRAARPGRRAPCTFAAWLPARPGAAPDAAR